MSYYRHVVATITIVISTVNALAVSPAQLLNIPSLGIAGPLQSSTVATPGSRVPVLSSTSSAANYTSNFNLTASSGHQISTDCDENLYGKPIIKSCLNLYAQIRDDITMVEFRDRTQGFSHYALPYRFISADGKCVLDIEAQSGFHADHANMAQISAAALHLLNTCVVPEGSGGKSKGYGEKGGLSVTLEEYTPHVVCQEEMSRYKDKDVRECHELLSMMPASEDLQTFGKKGDRGVQVELPFDLAIRTSSTLSFNPSLYRDLFLALGVLKPTGQSADLSPLAGGECGFFLNTNAGPQKVNWHTMWESATAIWGICGRKQQQGIAFTGNKGSINIAMYRPSDNVLTLKSKGNGTANTAK